MGHQYVISRSSVDHWWVISGHHSSSIVINGHQGFISRHQVLIPLLVFLRYKLRELEAKEELDRLLDDD